MTELFRITKPCSPILLMTGRQYQHRAILAAEDSGFVLKDTIYWDKTKAPLRAQRVKCVIEARGGSSISESHRLGNLAPRIEPIVYLFKPYPIGATVTDQYINTGLGCFDSSVLCENLVVANSHIKNRLHETEKPLSLFEILVELVTNKGHSVIDPFMGSGTTGVACANTGRKFIGIEMDTGYYEIAEKRIAEAYAKAQQA